MSIYQCLQAEDMIEEVKNAFKNNLPSLDWMDDETRAAAIDKVRGGGPNLMILLCGPFKEKAYVLLCPSVQCIVPQIFKLLPMW